MASAMATTTDVKVSQDGPSTQTPVPVTSTMFNEEDYFIHGHKRTVVLIGLGLVLFISALDSTIVSVALPVIGSDFNDYTKASWIVTAYLITYTAFLPIVSKFTDILGRRPVLVFSSLFFMVCTTYSLLVFLQLTIS